MGKKKATVGEKVYCSAHRSHTRQWRKKGKHSPNFATCCIKAIDRAIRKAAKDERRAIHAAIFNSFTAQGRPKEQRQAAAAIMAMIRRRGV